jgi:hypothetical protein
MVISLGPNSRSVLPREEVATATELTGGPPELFLDVKANYLSHRALKSAIACSRVVE